MPLSFGPSEASGVAAAVIKPAPARPPAPASSQRREIPSPPCSTSSSTSSVSSSTSSGPRSSTAVSCGTTNLPATTAATASKASAPPMAIPSSWVFVPATM